MFGSRCATAHGRDGPEYTDNDRTAPEIPAPKIPVLRKPALWTVVIYWGYMEQRGEDMAEEKEDYQSLIHLKHFFDELEQGNPVRQP